MNLDHINFYKQLNYYFTRWMTIPFEMAIKKWVQFLGLFHFNESAHETKFDEIGQFVQHIAFHN